MRRMNKFFWWGLIGLWASSALVAAERPQPMIGQPAPALALQSLEGKRVALQGFKGKFVVLHFGAGW